MSSSLQVQLVQIHKTCITREEDEEDGYKFLEINVTAVQLQQGVQNCGVFAIAFAYHAARGDNLSNKIPTGENVPTPSAPLQKKRIKSFPHTTLENHTNFLSVYRVVLRL